MTYDRLRWAKELLFPLVICASLFISVIYLQTAPAGSVERLFTHKNWFVAAWITSLFVANLITLIGVTLRGFKKKEFLWFEYPGSIMAAILAWVYTGTLLVLQPNGHASLAIGISFLLGVHFFINFLVIHRDYLRKPSKQ